MNFLQLQLYRKLSFDGKVNFPLQTNDIQNLQEHSIYVSIAHQNVQALISIFNKFLKRFTNTLLTKLL